jgi:phage-related protein
MPLTLVFPVQKDLKKTVNINFLTSNLGENYQQYKLKKVDITYSVSSGHLTLAQKVEIETNLEAFNGVEEFYFKFSDEIGTKQVYCKQWSFTEYRQNRFIFTGEFVETKVKECTDLIASLDFTGIPNQLDAAWTWYSNNTRDTLPNIANSTKLPLNSYHSEPGRRNYFPETCGTSEATFICAEAIFILAKWNKNRNNLTLSNAQRQYGIDSLETCFQVLYRNQQPPTNSSTRWLPHWLYNGRGVAEVKGATVTPNFLQSGYFDVAITFTNGVGTLPNTLSDVYKIYSGDLLWKFVFSPTISGTDYTIDYWIDKYNRKIIFATGDLTTNNTGHPAGTVRLTTNFSGTVKAVYALYTGTFIPNNTVLEAFPMWRNCLSGSDLEINHALDASHWAYNTYELAYELTNDIKYLRALNATRESTIVASNVKNESFIFKKDTFTTDPFSYAGTQLVRINGKTGTVTRQTSGSLIGGLRVQHDFSLSTIYGQLELQNFAVQSIFARTVTMYAEFTVNINTILYFGLSTSADPQDLTKMYYLPFVCAANTIYTQTFKPEQFLKWSTRTFWHPTNADDGMYTYSGAGGSATTSRLMSTVPSSIYFGESIDVCVSRLQLSNGSGFSGGGLALLENRPRIPADIYYKLSGNCQLWVKDASDKKFWLTLPTSATWTDYQIDWGNLTPEVSGDTPNLVDPITGIEFKTTGTCDLHVWWFGARPEPIPASSYVYKHTVVNKSSASCIWVMGDVEVKNSPLNELAYSPGVFPFTANYVGTSRVSWFGSPYVGYCSAVFWWRCGLLSNAKQVAEFKLAAQNSYTKDSPSGIVGVFRQVYNWARWDAIARPPYNVFVDQGADPNIAWEGYAHRAVDFIAEYWYKNPSDVAAKQVTMRFLTWLYGWFKQREDNNLTIQTPTDYPPPQTAAPQSNYVCPHGGLLIRACVWANLAGGDKSVTIGCLKYLLDFLNSEYVSTGVMAGTWTKSQDNFTVSSVVYKKYFSFWHTEIIKSLVILDELKDQLQYPTC